MNDYLEKARAAFRNLMRSGGVGHTTDMPGHPTPGHETPTPATDSVSFVDPATAATEPASWVDLFDTAAARQAPVSDESLSIIQRHVGRYTPDTFFPTDRERQRFLAFLRPRPGLSARLTEMHRCGLLGVLLPELQTIATMQQLDRLFDQTTRSGERFGVMLSELSAPALLGLSLLLQDAGTSKGGANADDGVRAATPALDRLHITGDARQTVELLLRNQHRMSRVAFRADAEDPDVVRNFAAIFSSEEQLKMLCLLTLAALGALNPEGLTPWKEELLWRLFVDAYNQMTIAYGDEAIDENEAVLAALQANRPTDIPQAEMAKFLEGLPRRYLTLFEPDDIYRHVRLWRNIGPDDVHFFLKQKGDVWELAVVTLDKAYLFSNICGVLAYFDLDILRGHALTSLGSLVLDVFQFADRQNVFQAGDAQPRFTRLLQDVVAGRVDITSLLQDKARTERHASARTPPVIYFDNDHSQRYTVLELVADDAPGLLHRISRVISRHGCAVDLVLISTEGRRAIDVFHVTKGAAKIADFDQLALTEDLERMFEDGSA